MISGRFDVRTLEIELAEAVAGEVRFSARDRALYAGQCCNVAVAVDWSKYLGEIVSLDPDARRVRVQPGCVLDDLRARAERRHLTFGPDPATHNHCTLGGMIGNNSCGVHSVIAGRTSDNVVSLDVLTYDGVRLQVGSGHLRRSGRSCHAPVLQVTVAVLRQRFAAIRRFIDFRPYVVARGGQLRVRRSPLTARRRPGGGPADGRTCDAVVTPSLSTARALGAGLGEP